MLRNILIIIPMLFGFIMGALAYLSPDIIGQILGVSADNAAGRGAISGDFGAVFFIGGGCAALALFKGKTKLLWIPITLFGLTIIGRLLELSSSGIGEGAMQPILIEVVLTTMLLGAVKLSKTV
ncbi:MAG: hypothetical protein ACPGVT_12515 [Maricaulaceae bacterium]